MLVGAVRETAVRGDIPDAPAAPWLGLRGRGEGGTGGRTSQLPCPVGTLAVSQHQRACLWTLPPARRSMPYS